MIVIGLLAANELNLSYGGHVTLEDWETGRQVEVATDGLRESYRKSLQDYLETTRRRMLENDVYYRLQITDQPLDEALRDFLKQITDNR